MSYNVEKLIKDEELEKKIKLIFSFNKSKCNIKQGRIIYSIILDSIKILICDI